MNRARLIHVSVIGAHALVGWGICGAVIGIGRQVTSLDATLVAHAVAVPVVFGLVSANYFRRFGYTSPLATASIFLGIAVALDGLVVAPLFEHSYEMFSSVLGTWIPFGLIFAATYTTGSLVGARRSPAHAQPQPQPASESAFG